MKLIVHITKDNLTAEQAENLYEKIKTKMQEHPDCHVNGQIVDKFIGSHNTGRPEAPGEI